MFDLIMVILIIVGLFLVGGVFGVLLALFAGVMILMGIL